MRPKIYLDYYSKVYQSAWKMVDQLRADRGKKGLPFWPEWCFMPLGAAQVIISAEAKAQNLKIAPGSFHLLHDIGILGALAAWRVTQGVYRFDPDVYRAVADTPLVGDLPHNVLFNLPEWCIYIETPGLRVHDTPTAGFFAHLEYDPETRGKELRLVLDYDVDSDVPPLQPVALHLGDWTIRESIERMLAAGKKQAKQMGVDIGPSAEVEKLPEMLEAEYSVLISILLYICSLNSEIGDGTRRPANPKPKRTKKGLRMFPPPRVTTWDVGTRMGMALRASAEKSHQVGEGGALKSSPRPHVRRAHWHGYWIGPRDGKQKYILKWLSPILVGQEDGDEMPVTIRPVD